MLTWFPFGTIWKFELSALNYAEGLVGLAIKRQEYRLPS
jgi:hypothetical protein